jgi:hypothetical protein
MSNQFGGGKYNLTAAAELRILRYQQSIATNPNMSFVAPRILSAFAEAFFPTIFFVDGRIGKQELDLTAARSFFQNMHLPEDFHRARAPIHLTDVMANTSILFNAHPVQVGRNEGGLVNNFVPDPTSAQLDQLCLIYTNFVNRTVRSLYPNPKGQLRKALNVNLGFFFEPLKAQGCTQFFPFGEEN